MSKQRTLATIMAMAALGEMSINPMKKLSNSNFIPHNFRTTLNNRSGKKGNKGEFEAKLLKRRAKNKMASKSRQINR